jgi:hypothetical protein
MNSIDSLKMSPLATIRIWCQMIQEIRRFIVLFMKLIIPQGPTQMFVRTLRIIPVIILAFIINFPYCAGIAYALDKPEYPIYGAAFGGKVVVNQDDLDKIANSFEFVYGHTFTTEEMDYARQINPDIKFVKYISTWRADGYVAESQFRRDILYYQVGVLSANIDTSATSFTIGPISGSTTVDVKASTVAGNFSYYFSDEQPSTTSYVTWLRIGDELMKVLSFNTANGSVTVQRNFDGAGATAHTAAAPVLCPEYGTYPGEDNPAGNKKLTYLHDPVSMTRFDKILTMLGEFAATGGDGVWIDILGAKSIGEHNINGNDILWKAWNFETGMPYTRDEYREKNEIGIRYVQETWQQQTGQWPLLFGNNIMAARYDDGSGGMRRFIAPTEIKPRPVDGMCMENFMGAYDTEQWNAWHNDSTVSIPNKASYKNWTQNVQTVMKAAQEGLSAIPLIINAGMKTATFEALDRATRHEWERWAYASYLIGVERTNGHCPTLLGTPMQFRQDGQRFVDVDSCYYWPIGDPAETRLPDDLDGYRADGHVTYARKFTNGLVLANPDETQSDALDLDQAYIDPDTGTEITTITMPPQSGRILLNPAIPTGLGDLHEPATLPQQYGIETAYPNPFNPSTAVQYTVPRASRVTLAVYDLTGRQVAMLQDGEQSAGRYTVSWNGSNDARLPVASGVYFIRMSAPGYTESQAVTLIK